MSQPADKGLIISPNFYNYGRVVGTKFREKGIDVQFLEHPERNTKFFNKIIWFFLNNSVYTDMKKEKKRVKLKRYEELIDKFNYRVKETIDKENFDFVLSITGESIQPETVKWIQGSTDSTPLLWTFDEINRLPNPLKGSKYYSYVYCFDPQDPKNLDEEVNAEYLPLAHDTENYDLIKDKRSNNIDVSFIGNLGNKRRREVISRLVKNIDANIKVWTVYGYNPFYIYLYNVKYRELGKNLYNTSVDHSTINKIYNRSKICLNIYKDWKVGSDFPVGLNMRTFEIPGAGGFQLVDNVEGIRSAFEPGKEIVTYSSFQDLYRKVRYYLEENDERERIAKKGYERAKSNHTFSNRVDKIIEDLRSEK